MVATDEREVFINAGYPVPPHVDGLIVVQPTEEPDPDQSPWSKESTEAGPDVNPEDDNNYGTIDDSASDMFVPVPLGVIDQKVTYTLGGSARVNATLTIQDHPNYIDYEVRVVPL